MKTLLINPPENTDSNMSLRLKLPPLGILYIAAYLEKSDMPVEILDANFSDATPENVAQEAVKKNPDIVGVTATAVTLKNALDIVKSTKRANPDIITMIGGPHVTYLPSETLEACPELDIVAIGEGEETALELARALKGFSRDHARQNSIHELSSRIEGVKGIAYRNAKCPGDIRYTPPRPLIEDLDSIPLPARHLVPLDEYTVFNKNETAGMIMTSRGCPFACNYCISSRLAGVKFRARSPKNVVDEIEFLYGRYELKDFEFIDDLFMMDHKRAKEISDEIKARGLDISWSASSRVNTIINYKPFGYSGKNVKSMLLQAYMRFYLRPSYIFKYPGTIPIILRIIGRNIKSHIRL